MTLHNTQKPTRLRDLAARAGELSTSALASGKDVDVITQIERAMERRGVSRAELARRLGHKHRSAVTRLLARRHEPGAELLQDIATALGEELVVPAVPAQVYSPVV